MSSKIMTMTLHKALHLIDLEHTCSINHQRRMSLSIMKPKWVLWQDKLLKGTKLLMTYEFTSFQVENKFTKLRKVHTLDKVESGSCNTRKMGIVEDLDNSNYTYRNFALFGTPTWFIYASNYTYHIYNLSLLNGNFSIWSLKFSRVKVHYLKDCMDFWSWQPFFSLFLSQLHLSSLQS